ncbi:hypothetical protein TNCV_3863641 [Trichonephila clavipes]|uniref:Uncharacterized protein n=1 Tax=Trichonephila clavipes TaxID=2585209 RepID=A0A8X6S7G5_TRICX|nr:hypothetical protein TNCV_3863641 [Trichonephila clavipes]
MPLCNSRYSLVILALWRPFPVHLFTDPVLLNCRGSVSLVVKVTDHDKRVLSLSPVQLKNHPVGGRSTLHLSKLKCPSIGVVWKSGEREVPEQVSPSSPDQGSKLRDSLPNAFE